MPPEPTPLCALCQTRDDAPIPAVSWAIIRSSGRILFRGPICLEHLSIHMEDGHDISIIQCYH